MVKADVKIAVKRKIGSLFFENLYSSNGFLMIEIMIKTIILQNTLYELPLNKHQNYQPWKMKSLKTF